MTQAFESGRVLPTGRYGYIYGQSERLGMTIKLTLLVACL